MFGATVIVTNNYKEKCAYSGYRKAFDGKGQCSFGNDSARNVIIFEFDNSSSSHTDNLKNEILILGNGQSFGINGSFGASEKKIEINFSNVTTKVSLSLHYNSNNSHLFVNGKGICKFKATIKMLTFRMNFV